MIGYSEKRSYRIIEIAGLPGTGKTTACEILSLRDGLRARSIASQRAVLLRKCFVNRLLLPFTVICFWRVLRVVHSADANSCLRLYPLWVINILIKAAGLRKFEKDDKISQEIFQKLNSLMFRYFLASIESFLRNKPVVIDEGFVQTGLGIWMRVPVECKQLIWEIFKTNVPSSTWSVIVACSTEESLRRAEKSGLRPVLKSLNKSNLSTNWLKSEYYEMSEMLRMICSEGIASSIIVKDNATPNVVADTLIGEIKSLINGQEILWWSKS